MTNNIDKSLNNVNKYANKPRAEQRRPGPAMTDEDWIKALLRRGTVLTIGTTHNSQPFLTPTLYIYIEEDNAIYYHSARVGRTMANVALNQQVCANVFEFGRILPHQEALEFNIEYNSVTVFGPSVLVEDQDKAERMLQALLDKYAPHLTPGQDYNPIQPEELKRTAVYQIKIEDWSGKRQTEPDDYPGAFYYEGTDK